MKTPRQRRKAKSKDAILDTASELIVRKGIENVSLRDIAREADYSPGALYRYFDGKAALLRGLVIRENQSLLEQLHSVPAGLSPEQRIIEACLVYIRYNLDHPAYPALVNTLASGRANRAEPVPADSPYGAFLKAVGEWIRSDNIPLEESYGPEEITYALWALTHGMATLRLNQLKDFDADFDSANRRTLELYLCGLKK